MTAAGRRGTDPVLRVEGLTKRFGRPSAPVTAVEDVSFTAARGEILGLLGANGAGKTTTIQCILGLTSPTAGRVEVLGMDVARDRIAALRRVNFSSAYVTLPSNLTVWENLNVFAKLYGIRKPAGRILELLELFEIPQVLRRVTGALSSGQQTRVNLAKAFLNAPEVLFLDEPTASLDPDIAARVRAVLRRVQAERGVTMLYTSHNMREVEAVCDRVIFLHKGRIAAEGSPAALLERGRTATLEDVFIAIARDGTILEEGAPACG